jgi:hypothetical protein
LRPAFCTIALTLTAITLSACGGGGGPGTDAPDFIDTVTPEPPRVQVSCEPVRDIQGYRYVFELKRDLPQTEEPDQATPNPLSEFADALSDLFSDMEMEGAFVAPDRSEILVRAGGEELELRTIGEESWIRVGATWQEQEPPAEGTLFTLASLCEDLVEDLAPSLAAAAGQAEVLHGIETVHYRLDQADLRALPQLLGRSGEEGLPRRFVVDVWLEANDGWPVRLEVAASDVGEEGEPVSEQWFIEFSAIDDPTIEIEPPPVSPAQT